MSFFNPEMPIMTRKPSVLMVQSWPGLWRIHWQIQRFTLLSNFYTRHDQACLLWGGVSGIIFGIAQFVPMSWTVQAITASGLTFLGIVGMAVLTWHFTRQEQLIWILACWAVLMGFGILLTDLSLILGWGTVLIHICPLWLVLSGLGYGVTGIGMRSRSLMLIALLHLVGIWLLPYVGIWQPLTSGLIISGSTLVLAELQWDSNGVCEYQLQSPSSP